ncbi:MAG TPA: transglutaminase family protein [Allosphingosinicella sp.]|nr:transglutaminase family protein [Allosphingosinicella sp.]
MRQALALCSRAEEPSSGPAGEPTLDPAAAIRAILAAPDDELDYAMAKLALDRIVDPSIDVEAVAAELDRMAEIARELAGSGAADGGKLAALRRLIYEAGAWNDNRPFGYDHSDPLGQDIRAKLISVYLATRLGNCVSMPILLLVLAEKLGLDMALALAPLHMFVRFREEGGRILNLEATSGAHPARDEWYRRNMPMSQRALANGIYLRPLSRRQAIAHIAGTVVEHLIGEGCYHEAIEASTAILDHFPTDVYAMVKQGTAYGHLLQAENYARYPMPSLIPPPLRPRSRILAERNRALFEAAEALGWEPVE